MRSYLILGMCVLFLFQYFLKLQWLEYTVVALSLLAFLGSALKADKFPRWLGIIMMTSGLLIEWNKGTGETNGSYHFLTSVDIPLAAPHFWTMQVLYVLHKCVMNGA